MKRKSILFVVLLGGAGIMMFALFNARQAQGVISPQETYEMMQQNQDVILLDVRTEEEFMSEDGHLANAILIPVQELSRRSAELDSYKDKTIIAYCRSGNRSDKAARVLTTKGFKAFNMEGGMVRWHKERLPVVKE